MDAEAQASSARDADLAGLVAVQAGVVSGWQLRTLGYPPTMIRSRARRGAWQRLHRDVFAVHSGPVGWRARCWAAVLAGGRGAVLSHATAARLHGMATTADGPIEISIPYRRRVSGLRGVVVHRRRPGSLATGAPLRTPVPETALDLIDRAESLDDVVGTLTRAVRARAPVGALRRRATRWVELWHRAFVLEVLGEVGAGIESALEFRYHRDVERAHGLPSAVLQKREVVRGVWIRADAVYEGFRLRVELDGELAHPGGATDADVWRDNAVLLTSGETTLRYRWSHVAGIPCDTAGQVLTGLRGGGWSGSVRRCGPSCTLDVNQ